MAKRPSIVKVGLSGTGRGVFAERPIPRGAIIARVKGTVVDDPDYSSDYCIDLGGSLSLEPKQPFRFLNHSCEPNCELFQWDGSDQFLHLEALRDISPDEELTIDYGWPAENSIPCACQSERCRGWIVAEDELHLINADSTPKSNPAGFTFTHDDPNQEVSEMSTLARHKPTLDQLKPGEVLCDHCTAKCCRYFALPIDEPTSVRDFDFIRWYILHDRATVFVEDDSWYLLVHTTCEHLQPDNRCGIYETRPQICREYTTDNCEYADDWTYDRYFETPEQVAEYVEAVFPMRSKDGIRSRKPDLLPLLS